ncbi:MAG: hypothetical protein ACRD3Q_12990 [Terriglobales bacterium]
MTTAAGNRLVKVWAADARFAAAQVGKLNQTGRFADRVDTERTAYIGHSFGGASALEACRTDPHCTGAVDLDGGQFGPVVQNGLHAPLLILGSENSCITGSCTVHNKTDRHDRAIANSLLAASTGSAWCYGIRGTKHFNFSDYGTYYLAKPLRSFLALGKIDGRLGLKVQNAYLGAFLDQSVKGHPQQLLARHSNRFPQVQVLRAPG